jgi:Nif-specific ferredoxin III
MSDDIITGVTRGGTAWTPAFITALNEDNCIGCGRCYKVCPRDVFELVERDSSADDDDDWDDDDDDDNMKVMRMMNALDCIGCQACAKVCPKDCHSHSPAPVAA